MRLPFFIARRYLFSKSNRNVINIISIVSAVAIGIGCLALIVILSVYNGFDSLVESSYTSYSPDYIITPSKGKTVNLADSKVVEAMRELSSFLDSAYVFPVAEETVYVQYDGVQSIARMKGVPVSYQEITRVTSNTDQGDFTLRFGELNRAVVDDMLAATLMLKPSFSTPLEIYLPSRTEDVSLIMPMESLQSETILPSATIVLPKNEESNLVFVPLGVAKELMELDDAECSKIEAFLSPASPQSRSLTVKEKKLTKRLRQILGEEYVVKDRFRQNETVYKMMRAEKFAVYMILIFVTVIISVNIFASLSMLIIDKKRDISTYKAMGATPSTVRRSFLLHGWLICMAGAVPGIILGLIICWIQGTFGVVPLPGNFVIDHYPVLVKASDVLITLLSVSAIGFIMAYLPSRSIK